MYSTLAIVDKDKTSLRSIIRSFETQIFPSDLAHLANTSNEGVLCRGGAKWWEQLGATKEEISEVLTGKKDIQVRDIRTSSLLSNVRVVYSVLQYTVLPRVGNIDVMTEVVYMVMFCLTTKRRINLIRLILDYILSAIDAARRCHAALPYSMLLIHVFMRVQLLVDGHKKDEKCPTTRMKTFTVMGLKH